MGFPWIALLAFLRIATSPVFPVALPVGEATELVEEWLAQRAAVVVHPTARHAAILHGLLAGVGSAGNLVTDAHLAALALEHGAELVSYDRDFGRFAGLRWRHPER